jgi:hypothetical protein
MPFVEEKELLEVIHVSDRRLRYFRDAGIIPFIKTGRISVLYDLDKVVAALQKLEQKPSNKRKRPYKAVVEPGKAVEVNV